LNIREKILVIEDEKSISHFISAILNTNGYEALQARSGSEALSISGRPRARMMRSGQWEMIMDRASLPLRA